MKKRLFSIILTIIMVLSLMPASVLADEEAGGLLTLLLPEGLSAEGMEMVDESTYKVTRTIENGSILPITISSQDQGAFSADLAEQININSSISSNNLNATYNSDDTLTLSGSPAASVEIDMNEVLTFAMEGMDAYDAQPAATGCVQVGSNMYASLKEAVSAASDGDTLWLTADDAAEQQVTIDKSLTIELQGHELSSTALKVTGLSTNVTINDRVGTGSINKNHYAGFSTSHIAAQLRSL